MKESITKTLPSFFNEKEKKISYHFQEIMKALGLDVESDGLKNTAERVAHMYTKELFCGLDPDKKPKIKLFENTNNYQGIVLEKNITFFSCCKHHFIPFFGKIDIAYIPKEKIIGLSKINRIVHYIAQRPQVQEDLTVEISDEFKNILGTEDVTVLISAKHLCIHMRGVKDINSNTNTAIYNGKFKKGNTKKELFRLLETNK